MATILKNESLEAQDIFKMDLQVGSLAKEMKPGQFLELKSQTLLRKPISIFDCDQEQGIVSIIYQIRGLGTKALSEKVEGEDLDLIGPLGQGFTIDQGEMLIVGGGIGIPPLYYLGKKLKEQGAQLTFVLGFNSQQDVFGIKDFEALGKTSVTTMDGSYGIKGHVGAVLGDLNAQDFSRIYSCGPTPMLSYVKQYGALGDVEVSLEAYMGCGVGACLSCVCELTNGDYARVCQDGPVFKGKEVVL